MKYTHESSYEFKGEMISFNYMKNPTLSQRMAIVDDIVNGVISDTVGYQPILFDYFVTVAFIVNVTDIELSQSFVESSEYIENCNLSQLISELVDGNIYEQIIDAAKKEIEFVKLKTANKSSIDNLADALTALVHKYSGMFDGLDVKAVSDNISKIAEMSKIPETELISNILKFEESKKN